MAKNEWLVGTRCALHCLCLEAPTLPTPPPFKEQARPDDDDDDDFADDYDSDDDDDAGDNNQMNELGDKFSSFSLVCFISLRFPRKDIFQWIH